MVSKLFDIVFEWFKKQLGVTGTLLVAVIIICAVAYAKSDKYVVSPDTLNKKVLESEVRLTVKVIGVKLDNIDNAETNLKTQKSNLEDKIDVPRPKTRHIEELKEVNEKLKDLAKEKKRLKDLLDNPEKLKPQKED
jgi:flagellar motility protein MotE (MotC chaperone)